MKELTVLDKQSALSKYQLLLLLKMTNAHVTDSTAHTSQPRPKCLALLETALVTPA